MPVTVTAPASTVRTLAVSASDEILATRDAGYKDEARDLQVTVADALKACGKKDGEFVPIEAYRLATLVEAADQDEADSEIETGRDVLVRNNIW